MIKYNYYCDNNGKPMIFKGLTNIKKSHKKLPKAIIEFNIMSQKFHQCDNYNSNKYRLYIKILNPKIRNNINFDIIQDIIMINNDNYKPTILSIKDYNEIYDKLVKK